VNQSREFLGESPSLRQYQMAEYIPKVLFPELQDPAVAALQERYGNQSDLGMQLEFAEMPLEEAAEMLRRDEVDVVVAGVAHDTPTVLRTAIHDLNKVIDPEKKSTITSFFAMEKEGEEPIFFADCAVHEYPDSDTLVTIAEQTCKSVKDLGYEPVVAFLSLSTFGSASHLSSVQKIKDASDKFKEQNPDIISYGEIQWDAATNAVIFEKKARGRQVNGKDIELVDGKMPNLFIFPDGVAGNIAYKLLEQNAGYTAVGPMLDGVSKPLHDSSRGATTQGLYRQAVLGAQLWKARHQQSEELAEAA
jgi:phosphotransacetylase